jgi:hypothetical protein
LRHAVAPPELNDIGAPNPDSLALKDVDETVEFLLGETNHPFRVAKASGEPTDPGGKGRQIGNDADVT